MAKQNEDKMLQAILLDENLMKFGNYTAEEICKIDQALDSGNYIINAVAQIIMRTGEGVSERDLWKEINNFLKNNV